jgi:hypothetical protein
MKSVKIEGFYRCMHNHLIGIFSLTVRRKTFIRALKISMDEEMARRSRK